MASTKGHGTVSSGLAFLLCKIRAQLTYSLDRPIFLTHNGRWRFAQVLMISIFGQFSGNGLGYFNATIFENIGVKSVSQQLGYNLLNSVLSAVGALSAVSLTDRMRRRPVLIYGTLGKCLRLDKILVMLTCHSMCCCPRS